MVGHQDRRVRDVAHQVVERLVVRERLVAAVVADNKQGPEHGALRDPVERPRPPAVDRERRRGEPDDHGDVPGEVGHGLDGVLLEALGRDGGLDVGEGEGRGRRERDLGLEGREGGGVRRRRKKKVSEVSEFRSLRLVPLLKRERKEKREESVCAVSSLRRRRPRGASTIEKRLGTRK